VARVTPIAADRLTRIGLRFPQMVSMPFARRQRALPTVKLTIQCICCFHQRTALSGAAMRAVRANLFINARPQSPSSAPAGISHRECIIAYSMDVASLILLVDGTDEPEQYPEHERSRVWID